MQARTADGSTWWADRHVDFVYQRRADGQFVEHVIEMVGERLGMVGAGDDLFVITRLGAGSRIYRIRGAEQAQASAEGAIHAFFADAAGRLVVADDRGDWRVGEALELEALPARGAALEGCTLADALATRGFVAACGGVAKVGSDLSAAVPVEGVAPDSIVGLAPNDLWGLQDGVLFHFDGERVAAEVELPQTEHPVRIVPTGAGSAVVMARDAWVATRETGCWEPVLERRLLRNVPWRDEPVVGIGPALVGWVYEFDFHELDVAAE